MSQSLKNRNEFRQMLISAGLILLILSQIFAIAIKEKMHQRIPSSIGTYTEAISIFLSHDQYDLDGYVGYMSIDDTLVNNGFNWDTNTDAAVLNEAIAKARAVEITDSKRILFTASDVGYADYTKFAFKLFGYNVESFLYLYILILFIQVAVFFMTFRQNKLITAGLILFLLSHYITANGLVGAGYNLWTFHTNRFLPVLGILPIMYLSLLAFMNKQITLMRGIGALLQIFIYILILRCRMSAFWILSPLLLIGGIGLLQRIGTLMPSIMKQYKSSFLTKINVALWPVILCLAFVMANALIKPLTLDSEYFGEGNLSGHSFWHTSYIGLAINPEIREIYGPRDPFEPIDAVSRFAEVCDEDHSDDSPLKARARTFVCKNRKIAEVPLVFIRSFHGWMYDYTQNDQDNIRAVLGWLRRNDKTEEYLYNFKPEDKVGYPRRFGQTDSIESVLANDPLNATLREFDVRTDFKWRVMERIAKENVIDAWRHHPGTVLKTVFIIKPLFFLLLYSLYFIRLTTLSGLVLFIVVFMYLFKEFKSIPHVALNKFLLLISGLFVCSMIVPLGNVLSE